MLSLLHALQHLQIPVIVHDGEIIWESAAITIYLGETFGVDAGLWPQAGKLRGRAMKWVVWGNVTLAEAASRCMMAGDDTVAAGKAKEDLLKRLAVLEGGLQDSDFLLGDKFSLADAHLNSIVAWVTMLNVPLNSVHKVDAWVQRVTALSA
jgi:glutathione S-transferase